MQSKNENLQAARHAMVENQLKRRDIDDPHVLQAFRDVPREIFLPPDQAEEAYADHPVPIGEGQTISQPYIVALTLQEARVQADHRVLDVGSGSGYQTALLSRLADEVHAIERFESLADESHRRFEQLGLDNVHVHVGDGSEGWPPAAPYDRILCGAAAPSIPQAWVDQLAEEGLIVAPIGDRVSQYLVRAWVEDGHLRMQRVCGVRFVPLIGRQGWGD